MVLDGPDGIETGVVGETGDADFFLEKFAVRSRGAFGHGLTLFLRFVAVPVAVILIENSCPDRIFSLDPSRLVFSHLPRGPRSKTSPSAPIPRLRSLFQRTHNADAAARGHANRTTHAAQLCRAQVRGDNARKDDWP